jgi:hypothetical protein
MTGPEALCAIKDGSKIRRVIWPESNAISLNDEMLRFQWLICAYGDPMFVEYSNTPEGLLSLLEELLMTDDWEIVE